MEIIEGVICLDYMHLCVSIPLKMAVSEFTRYLKGQSALMVFDKHPELVNEFERDFWACEYYSPLLEIDMATILGITSKSRRKNPTKKTGALSSFIKMLPVGF